MSESDGEETSAGEESQAKSDYDRKNSDEETRRLLADPALLEFISEEVEFRVREALQQRRSISNALLGLVLLLSCIGLTLVVNAYSSLENTRAESDRTALVITQLGAALRAEQGR